MNIDELREAKFLLWLGRFVGEWRTSETRAQIDRRSDGWLKARGLPEYDAIPLDAVILAGTLVRPPDSPLSLYPVRLSRPLMKLWLSAEKLSPLSNAWRVSTGMDMILKAIATDSRTVGLSNVTPVEVPLRLDRDAHERGQRWRARHGRRSSQPRAN